MTEVARNQAKTSPLQPVAAAKSIPSGLAFCAVHGGMMRDEKVLNGSTRSILKVYCISSFRDRSMPALPRVCVGAALTDVVPSSFRTYIRPRASTVSKTKMAVSSPAPQPLDRSRSEAHGKVWSGPAPAVWDLLVEAAEKNRTKTALVCMHQTFDHLKSIAQTTQTSGCLRWTFSELMQASHVLARSLFAAGIRPGMKIVAYLSNCAEFHVVFRAALELNCTFVPLNPASANNTAEVNNIFDIIKPSVLVTQDAKTAEMITNCSTESVNSLKLRLIAMGSSDDSSRIKPSWVHLESFITESKLDQHKSTSVDVKREANDVVLVLMTSGTTSLPKGCPHTNISLGSLIRAHRELHSADETRILCQHLPVSHRLTFVHPAPSFDAGSTLRAIHEEKCSDWGGVPAMAAAILDHPDFPKTDTTSMKWVILGATTSSTSIVQNVMDGLGCKVSDAFGMSEGAPLVMTPMRDAPSSPPSRINSGNVVPGAKVRVCDPETNIVVPRGEAGELHAGGSTVIREYLLNSSEQRDDSPFYTDDSGHWLKTGDQAVMDSDGNIEVVGRYKHLIIRGGENISPKAIEEVFMKQFRVVSDVVGITDEAAGEVPIAVVKPQPGQKVEHTKIKKALVKELGAAFAPESIVDLAELDLEDFPKTLSGKVQKNVLQEKLTKLFEQRGSEQSSGSPRIDSFQDSRDLSSTLVGLWRDLLGVDDLTSKSNIMEWADSLTLSRFPGVLQRKTGISITLALLTDKNQGADRRGQTLSKYIQIATARQRKKISSMCRVMMSASARRANCVKKHCKDSDLTGSMLRVRNSATTTRSLEQLLTSATDITPLYSFQEQFLTRRRPQSNNHRHAFVCGGNSVSECRAAVVDAMSRHPLLCSLAINFEQKIPFHVMVRPVEEWFDICITEVAAVGTAADLEDLVFNDPELDYAAAPGPLFRVVLTYIEEEGCAGMVYMAQHSVFDGISLPFFLEDLDTLLHDKRAMSNLTPRVPFKAWVDSEYNLRSSLASKLSVEWHARRLRGISASKAALFPVQKTVEWFKGDSTGWIDLSTGRPGSVRKSLHPDSIGVKGFSEACHLADTQQLKRESGVEVFTIIKAALALLNMKHMQADSAFFGQYQAARTWPYLPEWQVATLPPAMEVDGPTVQTVVVAIRPTMGDTVLSFMKQLQEEQELLTTHQHAPFTDVVDALNQDRSGDGDVMVDIWRRQIFNWLPRTSGASFKKLRKMQQISRTDVGILWNCMQLDARSVQIMPSWDDAQLAPGEVKDLLSGLLNIAECLSSSNSWGLTVKDIVSGDDVKN
nr:putative acyl-coa synthetase yngi [Quercus suber]